MREKMYSSFVNNANRLPAGRVDERFYIKII
jgi:hypothetical protein